MRVLVACEQSGVVRDAFRSLGHDAWSCDILPSDSPYHIQGDVLNVLRDDWDLMIAHPPCTHLSVSGARWCTDHWVTKKTHPDGRYFHDGSKKRELREYAVNFALNLWTAPIKRIAMEQPISILSTRIRKPDQIIHPWQFGHGESKSTCLWLKGLPHLTPVNIVKGREQRIWKMAPSPERSVARSITYQGIADAMAEQWGE